MDNYIENYIDSIITGRTNGFGFIDGLDDSWVEKLCEFAKATNDEWFLRRVGVKDPRDREDLKEWTKKVTQSGDTIPYDVFTSYAIKVCKYLEQHEGE